MTILTNRMQTEICYKGLLETQAQSEAQSRKELGGHSIAELRNGPRNISPQTAQ